MKIFLGVSIFLFVIIGILVGYGIAGGLFALLWNFLMPSLWHAAPHLSWKMGIAASWLLGIIQGLLGGFRINRKSE